MIISKTTKNFAIKRGLSLNVETEKDGSEKLWLYADTHQEAECWLLWDICAEGLRYVGPMYGETPEDMPIWIKDDAALRVFIAELAKTEEFAEARD